MTDFRIGETVTYYFQGKAKYSGVVIGDSEKFGRPAYRIMKDTGVAVVCLAENVRREDA